LRRAVFCQRYDSQAEGFALDQLQSRGRHPVHKEALACPHHDRLDQEAILVDQIRWHQRADERRAAVDEDVLARLLFELGDRFYHTSAKNGRGLPVSLCQG
jgi:hypothetical protein